VSGADRYADWDAAYVLGALTTPERAEFEEHLAGCGRCQAAVAELAGMPGLLAQVPPGEALAMEASDDGEAPPEPPRSLMPVLPRELPRRGGTWLAPVAAAAAALLIGGVGGYAASSLSADAPGGGATATGGVVAAAGRLAFTAVEPSLMTAVVDVVPVTGGTELRVECQYARSSGGSASSSAGGSSSSSSDGAGGKDGDDYTIDYAIWVVDRWGTATELRDWTARPGRVMHPVAVSALKVSQIGSIEIRRVDSGRTIMRASVA
jgi:hypothetical protein